MGQLRAAKGVSRGIAVRAMALGMACVAVGTVADALYLPHQSLWHDEAVQMSGLSLSPAEVTGWLAGKVHHDFGVGEDRMPPLSYWAGWAWSGLFGLGERSMRWFGVTCVAAATGILFASARSAWGLAAGTAAALLLATSPNVIVQAVEIRAYPLLILESAGLFACLIGYSSGSEEARRRWLIGMLACGLAAMYTHFFGLVALGGALVAAFVVARARGESVWPVITLAIVAAVAAVGLWPFVVASAHLSESGAGPTEGKVVGLVRMGYRLFAHPAMALSPVAVGLVLVGWAVGLGSALVPRKDSAEGAMGLALALASGAAVVALAHLAQRSFEAARPSYNVWMLPALALILASGLAARARVLRAASVVGILLTLIANLYAAGQLAVRGDAFAHTPHRHIAGLIHRYGPGKVALIHDGDTAGAWGIFSPVRYEFGTSPPQFSYLPDASEPQRVRLTTYPPSQTRLELSDLHFDVLIVVRPEQRNAKDIAAQLQRGIVPLGDGPVVRALLASGRWQRVEEETYLAFVGADVDVFRSIRPVGPAAGHSCSRPDDPGSGMRGLAFPRPADLGTLCSWLRPGR